MFISHSAPRTSWDRITNEPVGLSGLEPPTSRLSGVRSNLLSYKPISTYSVDSLPADGDEEIRTLDPLLARQVLSQLSYIPRVNWRPPALPHRLQCSTIGRLGLNHRVRDGNGCDPQAHRHQLFSVVLDNSTVKHILYLFFP